jgi:hypothetical protein
MYKDSIQTTNQTTNKQPQHVRDASNSTGTHTAVYIMVHIAWQAVHDCQRGPSYCMSWHGAHVYIGEMLANILAATCARQAQHCA